MASESKSPTSAADQRKTQASGAADGGRTEKAQAESKQPQAEPTHEGGPHSPADSPKPHGDKLDRAVRSAAGEPESEGET